MYMGGYYGLVVVTLCLPPRPPPRPQTFHRSHDNLKNPYRIASIFVSPVRSTYGGYYSLVVVTPRPQTLHRSHDNLKNPYRIASIFYM